MRQQCASTAKSDLIVSGDRHLLSLKAYEGAPIVRPIDFRRTLGLTEE
jgi:predicted nucleic acid-binding protein